MLLYLWIVYGRCHVTKANLSSPNRDCMATEPEIFTPEHLPWPLPSLTLPPSSPVSWRVKALWICHRLKAHLPCHFSQPCLLGADPRQKIDFYFLANGRGLVAATWSTLSEKGSILHLVSLEKRTVLLPALGVQRGSHVIFVIFVVPHQDTSFHSFSSSFPCSFTPNFFKYIYSRRKHFLSCCDVAGTALSGSVG